MEYRSNIDGVWHPDSLLPCMLWNGGRFEPDTRPANEYFHPFAKTDLHVNLDYFTKTLSTRFSSMQWCMPVLSNQLDAMSKQMQLASRSRGNLALACQDIKPTWLNKTEFCLSEPCEHIHISRIAKCVLLFKIAVFHLKMFVSNLFHQSRIASCSMTLIYIYNLMLSLAFAVLSVYFFLL